MIFLDIGAHNGQTLEEVTDPHYNFTTIYAFEPMPVQYAELTARYGDNPTVQLCNYGLADTTGRRPVYGTNDICEASIYPTKIDLNAEIVTQCEFVEATQFFREHIPTEETVIVKMNCEGSEIPILNNLIDSGEIWKITAMTFDLDIRRVTGHETEAEQLLDRLRAINFDRYQISSEAFIQGSHREKIGHWLQSCL